MKARWVEGEELQKVWHALPHADVPFAEWTWWEALQEKWGAILIEEEGAPVGLWPLTARQIGLFRLFRQPLILPWLPIRLREPLPPSPEKRYRYQAPVLRALGKWIAQKRLSYFAAALPPEWSYAPPFYQERVSPYARGSFVLFPGRFSPSTELKRKVRQAETLDLTPLSPSDALSLWTLYRPAGVREKAVRYLQSLTSQPSLPWRAWGVGNPPQAVGIFLWGATRVWYVAGARIGKETGQAMTRLLHAIIQQALQEDKIFDFMGSLLPGVERFFRQFGGMWETYYYISAWRFW
ncbi:MAG: hypothetical protein N2170_06815 [Bacteroidia bacterium]|nr:hypothetical protein [Bacteroidia bacterium]